MASDTSIHSDIKVWSRAFLSKFKSFNKKIKLGMLCSIALEALWPKWTLRWLAIQPAFANWYPSTWPSYAKILLVILRPRVRLGQCCAELDHGTVWRRHRFFYYPNHNHYHFLKFNWCINCLILHQSLCRVVIGKFAVIGQLPQPTILSALS